MQLRKGDKIVSFGFSHVKIIKYSKIQRYQYKTNAQNFGFSQPWSIGEFYDFNVRNIY
jgi:hypothetical protein